jgi:eukaryotic-like serine/threonine-protein kinase
MGLRTGTQLGPYEILSAIGAGGMGEVYKAHDTKLGRDVAIKILPEAVAHDPDRLARFQREAKMLASLNHSNIATIHGLEHSNGTHFLIMELVTGETLADRIKREGAVPLEEALKIAVQIAEALEAAHEKGIIHRDLKPANVKVTPEGKVKVLDFGLAKAFAGEAADSNPSQSPTLSAVATMQGVLLGTAAYMSPEQARGKAVDKRTDIWAFGCVLYELLCGRLAFGGEDVTEILAAVVKTEPDWNLLPEATPPTIRTLVRRCLRKDRHQRLQDAAGVRIEVEDALSAPRTVVSEARHTPMWRWMLVAGLSLVIGAAIAGFAVWRLRPTERLPDVTRLLIGAEPSEGLQTTTAGVVSVGRGRPTRTAMALSPNGKYLIFVGSQAGKRQLYVRAMDQVDATLIPGTEESDSPFFSPDGQWIGFYQGTVGVGAIGELKKVALSGGPTVTLCKTPPLYGVSWGSDDTIVLANDRAGGLSRVSASGGTLQPLTTVDLKKGEVSHRLPQVLPGGHAVLFTIQKAERRWDDAQIVVRSLVSGEQKVLVENGADGRYVPTGHLVFARSGTLMAVPFDPVRMTITGGPIGIIEGVMQDVDSPVGIGDTGAAQFSVSSSGSLAYLAGGTFPDPQRSMVWVDRKGATEPISVPLGNYLVPRLSPDGRQLTFFTAGIDTNVWIYDLSRGALSRVTTDGVNKFPIRTPDGQRVTFASARTGPDNLFWKRSDGSGAAERLTTDEHVQIPSSWSPDGKTLAFLEQVQGNNWDIWTMSLEKNGAAKVQPFLETPFFEEYAEFSPDGRWLAYASNESGHNEVYVQPFPGPGGRQQVSTQGGTEPAWAHNGTELFYKTQGTNDMMRMMSVEVTLGARFTANVPHMLFEGSRQPGTIYVRGYDVASDDKRFVMVQLKEQLPPLMISKMILVQNWFEELKRRVPTGK